MAKMTLTRALAEVKNLDKRIADNMVNPKTDFATVVIGSRPPKGFASQDEFINKAGDFYNSITDLITRRDVIKQAIIKANAETTLTVAGEEMTIATAIEKKDSIDMKDGLLSLMSQQYRHAVNRYDREVQEFDDRWERKEMKLREDYANNKWNAEDIKEAIEAEKKSYQKLHYPTKVQMDKLKESIDKLEEEVNDFKMEVDFSLSEANARTTIDV